MKKGLFILLALWGVVGQLSAELIQGQCGDGVIYLYDTDSRKMLVSGNGPMYDYNQDNVGPFYPLCHHMQSLVIEQGVTHIGNRAFWGCYSLSGNVTLPMSVTSVGDEAFYGCIYLTSLVMSPSIVSIGDHAFASCERIEGELVLPDCLETIGEGSFSNCKSLKGNLIIPNSVKSIGNNAFCGCEGFAGQLYLGTSLGSIGECAFAALNITGNLVIPESVTAIGSGAFDGCKYLTGNVTVPAGVTVIENCLFRSCSSITGMTILGQVTYIRNSAFNGCSALTDFVCYATTPPDASEYYVFDNIPLTTVYVPAESVSLYKEAWPWSTFEILPIGGDGIEQTWKNNKIRIDKQGGKLIVNLGEGCLKGVTLFDINGIEVLSEKNVSPSVELVLSSIPSGIYLLKAVSDSDEYCRKIVW